MIKSINSFCNLIWHSERIVLVALFNTGTLWPFIALFNNGTRSSLMLVDQVIIDLFKYHPLIKYILFLAWVPTKYTINPRNEAES